MLRNTEATPDLLNDDRLAILLLCSHLGMPAERGPELRILSAGEQATLVEHYGPRLEGIGELLHGAAIPAESPTPDRVARLLDRGGQLAIELESLEGAGIWAITRADNDYPSRLLERLGPAAPPALFGAGPPALLATPGIAVAGSRDLDPAGAAFAREIGALAAQESLTLYSGAARGADLEAAFAALDEGGTAVGIPADSLLRLMRDRRLGAFVRAGHLALATPFHPRAGFDVARAMARNKIVYCLAAAGYVAASGLETGGTWNGAVEAIAAGWVPVFVRSGAAAPDGNLELIRLGGHPITTADLRSRGLQLAAAPAETRVYGDDLTEPDQLPRLLAYLESWRTTAEIAAEFGASQARVRQHLKGALERGAVHERRGRFRAVAQAALPAFEP